MKKRRWVFLLVLTVIVTGAIGGAIIYLSVLGTEELSDPSSLSVSLSNLSQVSDNAITYIKLEDSGGVTELKRNEKNLWVMTGGSAETTNQIHAENIALYLSLIHVSDVFDSSDAALSDYGLDPCWLKVMFSTSADTQVYDFGLYTADKTGVYLCRQADSSIYIVDAAGFDGIEAALLGLRSS